MRLFQIQQFFAAHQQAGKRRWFAGYKKIIL
jgi:hypothetical protein